MARFTLSNFTHPNDPLIPNSPKNSTTLCIHQTIIYSGRVKTFEGEFHSFWTVSESFPHKFLGVWLVSHMQEEASLKRFFLVSSKVFTLKSLPLCVVLVQFCACEWCVDLLPDCICIYAHMCTHLIVQCCVHSELANARQFCGQQVYKSSDDVMWNAYKHTIWIC